MRKIAQILFVAIVLLSFFSCENKNSLKDVKTDDINYKLEIIRFDKDVFASQKMDAKSQVRFLKKKYGGFFDIYAGSVMKLGDNKDSNFYLSFQKFRENADLQDIYTRTLKIFENVDDIEKDLNEGLKHYKYYFPNKLIPRIATCISGFNYPIIATDSTLAISLDMYLGKKFEYYPMLGIPTYKVCRMDKQYISSDCMLGWAMSEFTDSTLNQDLISKMVYYGKMYYFVDAMFPDKEDSLKIGFNESEINWCEKNEANVWAFFIEKKLLYSSNIDDIQKYTSDGPFTSSISKESPSRIGIWVGWQIVRSYMKQNPNVKLAQLLMDKDAHKIFLQSKYKPKK
ncbi:MAG: gliding motility lipoprotein GldB [Bacteroidota bacterium]